MPRWKDRLTSEFEVISRFGGTSSNVHTRNAMGAIERLRDDGREYLGSNSEAYKRWERGCNELWDFINTLQSKRHKGTPLSDALEKFIDNYEHTETRLHQTLYSDSVSEKRDEAISDTWFWLGIIYRFCTYAILSTYLGEKRLDEYSVEITVNLTSGKRCEKWTRNPMQVPRKYRRPK